MKYLSREFLKFELHTKKKKNLNVKFSNRLVSISFLTVSLHGYDNQAVFFSQQSQTPTPSHDSPEMSLAIVVTLFICFAVIS